MSADKYWMDCDEIIAVGRLLNDGERAGFEVYLRGGSTVTISRKLYGIEDPDDDVLDELYDTREQILERLKRVSGFEVEVMYGEQ